MSTGNKKDFFQYSLYNELYVQLGFRNSLCLCERWIVSSREGLKMAQFIDKKSNFIRF